LSRVDRNVGLPARAHRLGTVAGKQSGAATGAVPE